VLFFFVCFRPLPCFFFFFFFLLGWGFFFFFFFFFFAGIYPAALAHAPMCGAARRSARQGWWAFEAQLPAGAGRESAAHRCPWCWGGVPSPKRPKDCPRARAFPGYSYRGGCHPPVLSSYTLVAPVGPASGCRGPPTIHPSIQVCLSFTRARDPFLHANHSCIHARLPVALGMRPSLSCTPTCRARFAGALLVIPDLPHPLNRGRCDASNGIPCPTQVAGAGHARGPAAQWWWAHGGPAGVIGGKNCTDGK